MDAEESRLYSPQPGGPQYANPLYYQPTQSAYAPQPGTMYYQPDRQMYLGSQFQKKRMKKSLKKVGLFHLFCM
ncbi:hypothetical protein ACT7CZ_21955 [Bacillus cereus]